MMVVGLAPLALVVSMALAASDSIEKNTLDTPENLNITNQGSKYCPTDDPSSSDESACFQNLTCLCKTTSVTMDLTCSQKTNTLELYDKRSGIPMCPKKLHCMDKGDASGFKTKYKKASCFCNDEMKSRSKQWKKNEMAKQLSIEAFKVTLSMIPHPNLDYYWNCSASVFVAIALFLTFAHFSICLNVTAKIRKIFQIDRRNGQVTSDEPIYQELDCDTTDSRPLDFYRNIKSVIAETSEYLELNDI